jgi:hypothetical protein
MIAIQRARSDGEDDIALGLLTQLVDWLPDDLKDKFKKEADKIREDMLLISSGQLPSLREQTDLLALYALKRKYLRKYSQDALRKFIVSLSHALEERGYYEFKQQTMEGFDRGSWKPPRK